MTELRQPENALIVHDGDGLQDAVDLGNGIFMSRGISNSYLVTTDDGDVLVNAGVAHQADELARRISAVSDGPIKVIVFTQSHPDHTGGWSRFDAPGVDTIAQANFHHVRGYWIGLEAFSRARIAKLWGGDLQAPSEPRPPEPALTTTFFDSYTFDLGGRRFELYSVPGGETLDSLVVWLPDDRIVFTGNMTGPIFGHVPNLYTVRGDKIRYVDWFIKSVQRVIDLEPDVLITGHGEPLRGAAEVNRRLAQIRDAAVYLRDRTFEGMNAGVDLWTLMGSISLPPELAIPQGHGKVPWIVRAIWEEHVGWFRYESTTELYDVPPRAVWPDLVGLAGGPDALAARGRSYLDAEHPLHALHLTDIALDVDPESRDALEVRLGAVTMLLERSGRENFSEVRWLESEVRDTSAALKRSTQ